MRPLICETVTGRSMAELLADSSRMEPCAIGLWGEPGIGLRSATLDVARAARTAGIVPIAASIEEPAVWEALGDRSILVIDTRGDGCGWRRLVAAGLRSRRSHLLLLTGHEEARHVRNIRLERVSAERLIAAVWPTGAASAHGALLGRSAAMARGLPAAFARQLWARSGYSTPAARIGSAPMRSRVAERKAKYLVTPRSPSPVAPGRAWPVPSEVGALRRQVREATEAMRSGRLASADREIRASAAALARRGDYAPAARGLLELGRGWLRRGRLAPARTAVREAGELAKAAGDDGTLIDAATLSGCICTDAAELGEAEALLRGGLAAARLREDPERVAGIELALSRALFWEGRYDDAAGCLDRIDPIPEPLQVDVLIARAEVAVGRREFSRAVSLAADGLDRAETGAPTLVGRAAYVSAFVHLALGDHVAVRRDAGRAVAASRSHRDPLQALRAQILAAESERRCGRLPGPTSLLARLARIDRESLPATSWALIDALRSLVAGGAIEPTLDRVIRRTGLASVRLFLPDPDEAARGTEVQDTLALLHLCQTSEDEAEALVRICATLRRMLRASAVGFLAPHAQGGHTLAADGRGLETALAERIVAAGQPLQDDPPSRGPEAGAPVLYAGRVLAALVARWTAGALVDSRRIVARLSVAAAAAGPLTAAVLDRLGLPPCPDDIVGVSGAIADLRRAIERAAAAPYPILVEGESGSGKELIARAVHRRSLRRDRAFCAVNCAALPDDLLEAELFGHARGAFTGAVGDRPGVFEEAHGGTLFLDEVGELSPRGQAKLLRTIQDGELRRLGESMPRRVDVRIVAATNRDLRHEVASGRFRLDLLYRLDVVRLTVPPLRERVDDIPMLVAHYWRTVTDRLSSRAVLSAQTVAALGQYAWPGNVRELQNVLAALAVRCPRRGVVLPSALPPNLAPAADVVSHTLGDARRHFEERFVRAALVRTGGHRGRAAAELGLTRQGLTKLLGRHGMTAL